MKPYYQDNSVTIYHGDCREILKDLKKVDSIITDPPYNFSTSSSGTKHSFWADSINAAVWFEDIFKKMLRNLPASGGTIWQFLNWKTMVCFQKALFDCELESQSILVWDKCWIGPGGTRALRPSYELIALILTGEATIKNRGLPDIWRHQVGSHKPNGHPAEKPISLLLKLCEVTDGKIILDPFMGSGTTLLAAKQLKKKAIGIEIEEKWCEVAANRMCQEVLEL